MPRLLPRPTLLLLALGILSGVGTPRGAEAQVEQPLQIAVFDPIQLRPADQAILALRVNFLYGRNTWVKGLDVGVVNHTTQGTSKGLQYGIVGVNEGNMLGWQSNVVNLLEGELTGLQSGFFNSAGRGEGVQWGGVNMVGNFSGLQVSFVNVADDLYGVQVGVINVIRSKATFPVLPLVNWKF